MVDLPCEEIDAIIEEVSAFDREPLSEDVLLKAVRFMEGRLKLEIKEERSEKGLLRFTSRRSHNMTTVRVVDKSHYHCWNYNIIQGDASDWDAKTTSAVVWWICGHPNHFIARPRVAK
jgi:hypothetical protein